MYFDLYTSRPQPGRPNIHGSQRAFADIRAPINFWNALFIRDIWRSGLERILQLCLPLVILAKCSGRVLGYVCVHI